MSALGAVVAAGGEEVADLLSRMEQRVLDLVGQGKANKEIAALLRLSDGTVRNYLSTIYAKLCVENRVEAAIIALKGLR